MFYFPKNTIERRMHEYFVKYVLFPRTGKVEKGFEDINVTKKEPVKMGSNAIKMKAPFFPCVDAGSNLLHAMAMWLINEVKIVPNLAEKYALLLYNAEIGSIARLKKKLTKNKNFLSFLEIEEDDIEDIVGALFPSSKLTQEISPLATNPLVPARNYDVSAQFIGHSGGIWSIIELSDGTICSGSADHTIRIWNVSTLACVKILGGHTNSVGKHSLALHHISFYLCFSTFPPISQCDPTSRRSPLQRWDG